MFKHYKVIKTLGIISFCIFYLIPILLIIFGTIEHFVEPNAKLGCGITEGMLGVIAGLCIFVVASVTLLLSYKNIFSTITVDEHGITVKLKNKVLKQANWQDILKIDGYRSIWNPRTLSFGISVKGNWWYIVLHDVPEVRQALLKNCPREDLKQQIEQSNRR